jgi:hypothetical protein
MAGRDVPFEHYAVPTAFKADHEISLNRSADRHGRRSLSRNFDGRLSKACDGLMHGRDQRRELVGPDLVAPEICDHDLRRSSRLPDADGVSSGKAMLPGVAPTKKPCPANSRRRFRISISITPILNHPFGSARPQTPPPAFPSMGPMVGEVESEGRKNIITASCAVS